LSLGLAAKTAKEMFGNDKLQHRVTEKLQTLVIKMIALGLVAQTGMRQRLRQQKRIAKLITDAFLDRTHRAVILSEVEESLNLLLDCDRISTPRSQNQPDENDRQTPATPGSMVNTSAS
jgi:hypothetical protein